MKNRDKTIAAMIIIVAIFGLPTIAVAQEKEKIAKMDFKHPLEAKLQRFEVVAGKEQKFKEWMDYLRRERVAAIATLDGERMYFEAVFSEKSGGGKTYVYWLTFNGAGGQAVENSTSELDRKHLVYWNECIVKKSRKVMAGEFYLTPEFLDEAIRRKEKEEKN